MCEGSHAHTQSNAHLSPVAFVAYLEGIESSSVVMQATSPRKQA